MQTQSHAAAISNKLVAWNNIFWICIQAHANITMLSMLSYQVYYSCKCCNDSHLSPSQQLLVKVVVVVVVVLAMIIVLLLLLLFWHVVEAM